MSEIEEAIKRVEESEAKAAAGGMSLYDSAVNMGELYVRLKNMGVDKEYILDLIRIPFMFAAVPDKPQQVADTLADTDAVDRSN